MGYLTVVASGQHLTVNIQTPGGHPEPVFSDAALSTPITLPLAITADQDFYLGRGSGLVTVTVTTPAGLSLLTQTVEVQTPDHVVLTPLPTEAQQAQTDANAAYVGAHLPEAYGAKGDGTTDDTTALVAAINAASAANGTVHLSEAKTYLFSTIELAISNVTVQGAPGATLLSSLSKTATTPLLHLSGSNVHVRDVTFSFQTAFNIDTDPIGNVNQAGVRFGVIGAGSGSSYVSVERCRFTGVRNTSIEITGCDHVRVIDNTCQETGQGIFVSDCTDVEVRGNYVSRSIDDCIAVAADAALPANSQRVIVSGNTCRQGYAQGIDFTGADGAVISDNVIDTTWAPGILVYQDTGASTGPTLRTVVTGNVVRNAGTYFGVGQAKTAVSASPNGIEADDTTNVTISGNIVYDTQGVGINGSNNTGLIVTDNQVIGSGGAGIDFACSAARKDLQVTNNYVQLNNGGITVLGASGQLYSNVRIVGNLIRSYKNGGAGSYRGVFFAYLSNFQVLDNNIINDNAGAETLLEFPASTSTGRIDGNSGYNPVGNPGSQPTGPANAVAVTNPFYEDATVYLSGGTGITGIFVHGPSGGNVNVGTATPLAVRVPVGATIQINTGTTMPTWLWVLD